MSSGNLFERLFKLWASVCKLVLDGKRSPEYVCEVLQSIVDGKALTEAKPTIKEKIKDWVAFYKDVFGLDLDFSGVAISESKPGFDRLLIVAQGMTPMHLFNKCKELFPSWKYTDADLDGLIKSVRSSKDGTYAIWIRDRDEADEENQNLSATQLKVRGDDDITLEERMLYELKFFKETNGHLDKFNWTLCAGSRGSGGHVPLASWGGGRFEVRWDRPGYAGGFLRSRSVVS